MVSHRYCTFIFIFNLYVTSRCLLMHRIKLFGTVEQFLNRKNIHNYHGTAVRYGLVSKTTYSTMWKNNCSYMYGTVDKFPNINFFSQLLSVLRIWIQITCLNPDLYSIYGSGSCK